MTRLEYDLETLGAEDDDVDNALHEGDWWKAELAGDQAAEYDLRDHSEPAERYRDDDADGVG